MTCDAAASAIEVHLRGLIEIGNHCRRDCLYCGIRHVPLADHERYPHAAPPRSSPAQSGAEGAWASAPSCCSPARTRSASTPDAADGLPSLCGADSHDQGAPRSRGDAEHRRARRTRSIAALREAGADRYLLRFETSDPVALPARIHPPIKRRDARDRFAVLRALRELGYEVGSGIMVGIPGQSRRSLADDLLRPSSELDLDMVGVGTLRPPARPRRWVQASGALRPAGRGASGARRRDDGLQGPRAGAAPAALWAITRARRRSRPSTGRNGRRRSGCERVAPTS
jgi:biotin synthase